MGGWSKTKDVHNFHIFIISFGKTSGGLGSGDHNYMSVSLRGCSGRSLPPSSSARTRLLACTGACQTTGHRNSGQQLPNLHLYKKVMKGPVSHSRESREALDHIMQWHVHIYLAIWDQECLLVTDSTSSMYGPRTEMGAQLKEKSLGGTLVQETLNFFTKTRSNLPL